MALAIENALLHQSQGETGLTLPRADEGAGSVITYPQGRKADPLK